MTHIWTLTMVDAGSYRTRTVGWFRSRDAAVAHLMADPEEYVEHLYRYAVVECYAEAGENRSNVNRATTEWFEALYSDDGTALSVVPVPCLREWSFHHGGVAMP